jgi:hypothetical protein
VPNWSSNPSAVRPSVGARDPSVVDEYVNWVIPSHREGSNRSQAGKVKLANLCHTTDCVRGLLSLGRIADGEHHASAVLCQRFCCSEAVAAVRAGYYHGLSGRVGHECSI